MFVITENKLEEANTLLENIDRGCKAAILKTLLDNPIIHFHEENIKAGADFLEKTIAEDDKKTIGNFCGFITVKELRFIKRISDALPELDKKIHFYLNGLSVKAPWIREPEKWKEYGHKHSSGLASITVQALEFASALASKEVNIKPGDKKGNSPGTYPEELPTKFSP